MLFLCLTACTDSALVFPNPGCTTLNPICSTEKGRKFCACAGTSTFPICDAVTSNSCTATNTAPGKCKCGSNIPCTTGNMCNADGTCSKVEGRQ